jgi:phospholipase/carboxylesterase
MGKDSYIYRTTGKPGGPLLFAFHGTGGDENQLLGLGQDLVPDALVVAPRGDVSEQGAARFFRRTGEGVYDMADLAARTARMADFIKAYAADHPRSAVLGLGYSNGANILASVMFAEPALFDAMVLMHPLIPFEPQVRGDLASAHVLMTAGRRDPICPPQITSRLENYLRALKAEVQLLWHEGGHEVRPVEIETAGTFLRRFAQRRKEHADG